MKSEGSFKDIKGVPDFKCMQLQEKQAKYCVLIPVINEGNRIRTLLKRAENAGVWKSADIIICDGGSTDGSLEIEELRKRHVNTLLVKTGKGRQGAQLRMGFWYAIHKGYQGFITIDGNNKDSIEDVPVFAEKLERGYDFVQGSRFIKGGRAENTPLSRYIAVRFLHAPVISLTARKWYTDTTNAYRGYSLRYIKNRRVGIFRDIFEGYELLAYLSVRASQLGMKTCEVPVARIYPKSGKIPTKISFFSGNLQLLKILFINLMGGYQP